MNTRITLVLSLLLLGQTRAWSAQEDVRPAVEDKREAAAPTDKATDKGLDRAALEKEFAETLTDATLQGFWQVTAEGGLTGTAPMTTPRPESYDIRTVTKIGDDRWAILARINFADKDVTIPVPVRVVWAEDTAIITLTDLSLPMLGTYSARVMIHHGFYSGVWYSTPKNYGGVLSGRIIKTKDLPGSPEAEMDAVEDQPE